MCGICDIVVLLKFDVINNYRNNSEIIFSVEWYICNHKNKEYVRTTIEDIAKIISLTKRGFYN